MVTKQARVARNCLALLSAAVAVSARAQVEQPAAPVSARPSSSVQSTAAVRGEAPPPAAANGAGPVPLGDINTWFPPESYPAQARARGEAGRTAFALDIDAQGRVTNCSILESSGSELLDSTTCSQAILNGRFHPARDAGGKPVAGRWSSAMRWKITESAASEDE